MVPRPRHGLSLCSGGAGLDMGLMLAEPGFHTRCFVEWEEYPRRSIIAAQRAGYLAPAPIWDDLTSFDARPLAGAIDTLLAGYPCQPFSAAGQRRGTADPRHLWPHVARVARELGDGLRWIVLENVAGHVSLGAEAVLRELWHMGFTPAAGTFSAAETGAPHRRERWFCVAYRRCSSDERWRKAGKQGEAPSQERTKLRSDLGRGSGALAHADGGHPERRYDARRSQGDDGGGPIQPEGGESDKRRRAGDGRDAMADASGTERERIKPGQHGARGRQEPHGYSALSGGAGLFPPGPADRNGWDAILRAEASRAPAFSRGDIARAALRLASMVPADAAGSLEPDARGMADGAIAEAVAEAARCVVGGAAAESDLRRLDDGLAHRSRALRLLGNGVVPLVAGHAWRSLAAAHGLRPVGLEAAREGKEI